MTMVVETATATVMASPMAQGITPLPLPASVERGYHATVLSDAVAAFNPTELKAALDVNYPIYAHALLTTERFVSALAGSKE